MARLVLIGNTAEVELTTDDEDDQVIAVCKTHFASSWECTWTERYDDLNDATEYAADHADTGRQK